MSVSTRPALSTRSFVNLKPRLRVVEVVDEAMDLFAGVPAFELGGRDGEQKVALREYDASAVHANEDVEHLRQTLLLLLEVGDHTVLVDGLPETGKGSERRRPREVVRRDVLEDRLAWFARRPGCRRRDTSALTSRWRACSSVRNSKRVLQVVVFSSGSKRRST